MTDDPKPSPNVRVGAGAANVSVTATAVGTVRQKLQTATAGIVAPTETDANAIIAFRECQRIGMRVEWERMGEAWMVTVSDDEAGEVARGMGDDPIKALVAMARYLLPPGTVFPGEPPGEPGEPR